MNNSVTFKYDHSNMMLPFGNLTVYFKLPDWFDDWDTVPEEKEDDPPDVKALKVRT